MRIKIEIDSVVGCYDITVRNSITLLPGNFRRTRKTGY